MWRFKQFMPKEQSGLEGRTIDIANLKLQIRNAIAEGGFSCVYLARDVGHSGKQYALKHIICNDEETLDLVKKEVSVMKSLKGHPNVVSLQAQTVFDMGRTKEVFIVMELCEKSLVSVLENRGVDFFEEKHAFLIFRDVCNAVFAMHVQSPPIAHRDLKAENVLLGVDGSWKLCDFGSSSTNHKRFERPEEMGIEEDNIRKHTTPAYRAPEMWDLFRREIINEKVDIWALGCLLYRICYLKSAFDGDSKLQILNGNYRIPELPKYSSSVTDLIKDMLQATPDARPDIMQVWFRVNEHLPPELQKQTLDRPMFMMVSEVHHSNANAHSEGMKLMKPRRSPPVPPSSRDKVCDISPPVAPKETHHSAQSRSTSKAPLGGLVGNPLGAFWSGQHALDSHGIEDKGPVFDDEPVNEGMLKHKVSYPQDQPSRVVHHNKWNDQGTALKKFDDGHLEKVEIRFFPDNTGHGNSGVSATKESQSENAGAFGNEAFNAFVADFDSNKLDSGRDQSGKEELQAEVDRLKEQLKQAYMEKAEIASKYEKLSAICRSQRLEVQELKQAISANSTPNKDSSPAQQNQKSPRCRQSGNQQKVKIEGSMQELQQGLLSNSSMNPSTGSEPWQAFADVQNTPGASRNNRPKSVRTNGLRNKQTNTNIASDTWGFGQDVFTATPTDYQIPRTSRQGNSQRFGEWNKVENKQSSQPSGWAGF